jgi:hypothetical protein
MYSIFDFKQDFFSLKKNEYKESFPCLMPLKNDIDFLKIFSQENILVKSPYYEKSFFLKGNKGNTPLFSPTTQPHPRNDLERTRPKTT